MADLWISLSLSTSIFFVQKKDVLIHLVIDYCYLSAVMAKNRYSISLIKELLDQVGGARLFSKIDLTADYNQVCIREEDIPKSTFRTKKWLIQKFGHELWYEKHSFKLFHHDEQYLQRRPW